MLCLLYAIYNSVVSQQTFNFMIVFCLWDTKTTLIVDINKAKHNY